MIPENLPGFIMCGDVYLTCELVGVGIYFLAPTLEAVGTQEARTGATLQRR